MSFLPVNSEAPYLPTTQVFPEDESQRLIVLTENYSSLARGINQRTIGNFSTEEVVTGNKYFDPSNFQITRGSYRKSFELAATAAGATTNIAHGITGVNSAITFVEIGGNCLTATPDNRPIPYTSVSALTAGIEIKVDGTNIVVTNGSTAPNITSGLITLEYLKN